MIWRHGMSCIQAKKQQHFCVPPNPDIGSAPGSVVQYSAGSYLAATEQTVFGNSVTVNHIIL